MVHNGQTRPNYVVGATGFFRNHFHITLLWFANTWATNSKVRYFHILTNNFHSLMNKSRKSCFIMYYWVIGINIELGDDGEALMWLIPQVGVQSRVLENMHRLHHRPRGKCKTSLATDGFTITNLDVMIILVSFARFSNAFSYFQSGPLPFTY